MMRRAGSTRRARRGLTLIELLISLIVGVVVIGSATGYVRSTNRNLLGAEARADYTRKGRFLGLALRRDLGEAGVGLTSTQVFGSVAVFNDTVTVLKVPYTPNPDPIYNVVLGAAGPATSSQSTPAGCGATCLRLRRNPLGTALTLQSGMLAVVTQNTTRRLIIVNTVGTPPVADSVAVTFRGTATLLHKFSIGTNAGTNYLTNITPANPSNTTVQRVELIAYWRDASNNLWRATRMNPANGALVGEIIATGCTAFTARLVFSDGTTAATADSTLAGHYYNQINAIIVTATFASDIVSSSINGGVALSKTYTIQVQPRNLIYERNR